MASAPESILILWQELAECRPLVSKEFWDRWELGFGKPYSDIKDVLSKITPGDISVNDAKLLDSYADALSKFTFDIKPSPDGRTTAEGLALYAHHIMLKLIRHHIGNDLHLIKLLLDVGGADPEPVPSQYAEKIVRSVGEMGQFWNRIRQSTVSC